MRDLTIQLEKDLIFFDIESTGLNVLKDRILQIALIKYSKDKPEPQELFMLINPGIPISEEAFAVHGISNDMIRNKPTFAQVGKEIFEFIGNADLAGYNSDRFDIPMLMEELHRIGYELDISKRRLIDVQKIFYKMEPRTLKAAYRLYCNGDLSDAHDALADARATVDVFKGQLLRYENVDWIDGDGFVHPAPIKNDIEAIATFIRDDSALDVTQRLKYNAKGEVVFNFGKYAGHVVAQVFRSEPNYYHWIMEKDFSAQVKQIVKKIFDEMKKPDMTVSRVILILGCMWLASCYTRKEGCLDNLANNYDVTADDACVTCCKFPALKLQIKHFLGDSIYRSNDTLINDNGQKYIIEDVRYYLSEFSLFQSDSVYHIREKIKTTDNLIIIDNDMKIMRSADASIDIGTVSGYGRFDSLKFNLGLSTVITNNSFGNLDAAHVLLTNNKLKDGNGNTAYLTLRYKRLTSVKDSSITQTIYVTQRPQIPTLVKDTVVNTVKGSAIVYPIKADYKVLLQNLDLTLKPDSLGKLLSANLKNMIIVK